GRWELDPFGRMDTPSRRTDKGTFEVQSENFRAGQPALVLDTDVFCNGFDAAERVVGACGDCRRDHGGGSISRDHTANCGQRLSAAFHHIVAARTVNVYIEEAGNGSSVERRDFLRAGRQRHGFARAEIFDDAVAQQNSRVSELSSGSEGATDSKQCCAHKQKHRNGNRALDQTPTVVTRVRRVNNRSGLWLECATSWTPSRRCPPSRCRFR